MVSQDLIPQFTQASQTIPASQPDRSHTPRRPHQDWHQFTPTFRGPMHYAMAASRPMWLNSGVPPPPPQPPTLFSPPRPSWTASPSTTLFPPTPPILPHGQPDHNPFAPQRCGTTTARSPPSTTTPPGNSPIRQGYTCRPCEIPPVDAWKPDVDYTVIPRLQQGEWFGLPRENPSKQVCKLQRHRRHGFHYKSGSGSSYTRAFTIPGFVALPTGGKLLCSHLTT